MKNESNKPSNEQNMSLEGRIKELEVKLQSAKKLKKDKKSKKRSLKSFRKEYLVHLKSYSSPKYVESVELTFRHLIDSIGEVKSISKIDRKDVSKVIAKLKVHAPNGYRVYLRNLKAAFNVALDWEYIKLNPFANVKLPKKQKVSPAYITLDELNLILDKMKNKDLKEIVYFAFFTGCRKNEILSLRWKDIDFSRDIVTIGSNSFTTKTKSQRNLPLPADLKTKLWKRSEDGKRFQDNPDGYVFAKPNGFPFHEDVPTKAFKAACREIGLDEKLHFHSLRHSFASYHVSKGTDLYLVKELLGHSSITTTEIYSHLDTKSILGTVKVFDDVKKVEK